jgi:peptidyl-tRNA hydrolase, PTH2 family
MEDVKQVIVVRKDLRLRRSEMAAQVAHASMKFLLDNDESERGDELTVKLSLEEASWLQGSYKKIIVGVNSEADLKNLLFRAEMAGVSTYTVTQKSGSKSEDTIETVVCAAFGPDESSSIDKITGHLKLI